MELVLPQAILQGACQVALDGGNIFIAGGRQLIEDESAWVDFKTGIVVTIKLFKM